MTPFDPIALLAMLRAFYPVVGPAALALARRERPEYFAGGTLIGTHGDALRLPDARVFDLIFNVFGADTRWQVELDRGDAGDVDTVDPFALEEGPILPLDLSAFVRPAFQPIFEPLVVDTLAELGGARGVLDGARGTIVERSSPAGIDAALGGVDDAASVLPGVKRRIDESAPDTVVMTSGAQSGATLTLQGEYDEQLPGELPPDFVPPTPRPPFDPEQSPTSQSIERGPR